MTKTNQPTETQKEKTMSTQYIARQSPNDDLWYALGNCGCNQWMPISGGYRTRAEAQDHARLQPMADAASVGEIAGAESETNQLD